MRLKDVIMEQNLSGSYASNMQNCTCKLEFINGKGCVGTICDWCQRYRYSTNINEDEELIEKLIDKANEIHEKTKDEKYYYIPLLSGAYQYWKEVQYIQNKMFEIYGIPKEIVGEKEMKKCFGCRQNLPLGSGRFHYLVNSNGELENISCTHSPNTNMPYPPEDNKFEILPDGSKIKSDFKSHSMPNPTKEELKNPLFNAIFQTIKTWDVNVPDYYDGYCGANGSHAVMIFKAIEKAIKERIGGTFDDWNLDILGIPSDRSLGSAVEAKSFCGWRGQEGSGHIKEKCLPKKCECGGETARTTHSDWCPKFNGNC